MDCISKVWLYLQGWIVNPKVGLIYPRFISKGWIVSNGCIFQGWIECIYKDGFYLQEWIVSPRSDCIPRLYLLSMMIISPKLCLPRIDGISKVYLPRMDCISKVVSLKDELYHLGCICKVVSPKDGLYLRGCICKVVFPRLEWYRRIKAWTPDIILIWEVGPILSLLHGLGRKLELSSNTFFLFNNGLFCQRLYTTSMRNQHHKS